jgi:hypothetical protein
MIPPQILIIAAAILTASAFATGWKVHSWKDDAQLLAVATEREIIYKKAIDDLNGITGDLQVTLDALASTKAIKTREIIREVTKTEYRCEVPEAGVNLFNESVAAGYIQND